MYDYQVTNSEGRLFNKLVFFSWCAPLYLDRCHGLLPCSVFASVFATKHQHRHSSCKYYWTRVPFLCRLTCSKYVRITQLLPSWFDPLRICSGCNFSLMGTMRRSPDTSRVKAKMMYASTKDFFKSYLEGLAVELQVTCCLSPVHIRSAAVVTGHGR